MGFLSKALERFNIKTTERYLQVKKHQSVNIPSSPDDICKKEAWNGSRISPLYNIKR